jgi:hypothetical protein
MTENPLEKMLNLGLKLLERYLKIPSVVRKRNGYPKGWTHQHISFTPFSYCSTNANSVKIAMKHLANNLNKGSETIPKEKLKIMFVTPKSLPRSIIGKIGIYNGIAMRIAVEPGKFGDSLRFDIMTKFVDQSRLKIN